MSSINTENISILLIVTVSIIEESKHENMAIVTIVVIFIS